MHKRTIAVDFDGTICANAFPSIGEPNQSVIRRLLEERKRGSALILWTCREGKLLEAALLACRKWGLTFDAVNESTKEWIQRYGNNPRKIGADEYWDDKAVRICAATYTEQPPSSPDTVRIQRKYSI